MRRGVLLLALASAGCEQILGIHDLRERSSAVDLTFDPASTQDFGELTMGTLSAPAIVSIANHGTVASGELSVELAGADPDAFVVDASGCERSLAPEDSCTAEVRFRPSASASQLASLQAVDGRGAEAELALIGQGTSPVVALPSELEFGNVTVDGSSVAAEIQLINTGGVATNPLTVGLMSNAQFEIVAGENECDDAALEPGGSCALKLRFNPTAAGEHATGLLVSASGLGSFTAPLSGTGLARGALTIAPESHDFQLRPIGTSSAGVVFTIDNTGVTSSGALDVEVTGPFTQSGVCDGVNVAGGGTCTFTVTFAPSAAGLAVGSILVTSANLPPAAASISGIGTANLQVNIGGGGFGQGRVTSAPAGIDCPAVDCSVDFSVSSVTLTATPSPGSTMAGWSGGGCSGNSPTCVVTMDQAQTVTATFAPTTVTLTVQMLGNGFGRVTSPTHPAIDCSNNGSEESCQVDVPAGTTIQLNPLADPGSHFEVWCGVCIDGGPNCSVVLDSSNTAQAYFCPNTGPCTLGC